MKWIYDGYTKIRIGSGKNANYKETTTWGCSCCGCFVKVEGNHMPNFPCPKCGNSAKEDNK